MGGGSWVDRGGWDAEAVGSLALGMSRSLSESLDESEGGGRAGADLRRVGAEVEADVLGFEAGRGGLKAGGARFLGTVGCGGMTLRMVTAVGDVERSRRLNV